ncbi:MAG: DUF4349 domain-containing protein, partial [Rhodopila sp.]
AEVQGTVESLTAQRDYLRTVTDTVRVDVSYNGLIQQAGEVDLSPLRAALDDFLAAMIGSAGDMVTWIAVALPWLPLAALGLWLARALLRRREPTGGHQRDRACQPRTSQAGTSQAETN